MAKFNNPTGGEQKPDGGEAKKTFTQEEVDKLLQAESDRRVNQALEKEKKKWIEEVESQKKEAERLGQLSAEERLKEELKKRDTELNQLKDEMSKKELLNTTKDILNQRGLPISMANQLMGQNAEQTMQNINNFETAWKTEKQNVVNEMLKGSTPKNFINNPLEDKEKAEEEKIREQFRKSYNPIKFK